MSQTTFGKTKLKELEAEVPATRKCIERIPMELYPFKPHEKSMDLGYLTLLVIDIPRWIRVIIEQTGIDFATDEALEETFYLKNNGQVLYSASKLSQLEQTVNHMVHHRGQLTVYMRMNNIAIPSIYGPSGDERNF